MPPRSCDVAVEQYEIRELTFANIGDCVKMRKNSKGRKQHVRLALRNHRRAPAMPTNAIPFVRA